MNNLEKLYFVVDKQVEKFGPSTSFQIMTRLIEEAGELAEQVNLFEDMGEKRKKLGEPNKKEMGKEMYDVLKAVLSLARAYNIENELEEVIDEGYNKYN